MYFLYYRFASVILGLRQFLFVIYYAYTVFVFFLTDVIELMK